MVSGRRLALGEQGDIETTPQYQDEEGKWKTHATGRGKGVTRWRARAYFRGQDGVSGEKSRVAPTKRGAIAAVERALSERSSVGEVELRSSMLFVKAGEIWLSRIARSDSNLSVRTIRHYRETYLRYVDVPGSSLRGLSLEQVNDPQRIRAFLVTIADTRGTQSSRITKTVLSSILNLAVDSGVLMLNVARTVSPVTSQVPPKETLRDTDRSFTVEELSLLLRHAEELAAELGLRATSTRKRQAVVDLVSFMAGTGVRIGEARGFLWEHIDLESGTADVEGTKTKASRRRVTFPAWLAERMRERAERVGATGLVFHAPHLVTEKKEWDQSNCSNAVAVVIKGAGMGWATPHSFRRTVATRLHDNDVPLVRIADQLGHANPRMTLERYIGREPMGNHGDAAKFL